jgi:hypothetical protein
MIAAKVDHILGPIERKNSCQLSILSIGAQHRGGFSIMPAV